MSGSAKKAARRAAGWNRTDRAGVYAVRVLDATPVLVSGYTPRAPWWVRLWRRVTRA
jgi:hypothetical protein